MDKITEETLPLVPQVSGRPGLEHGMQVPPTPVQSPAGDACGSQESWGADRVSGLTLGTLAAQGLCAETNPERKPLTGWGHVASVSLRAPGLPGSRLLRGKYAFDEEAGAAGPTAGGAGPSDPQISLRPAASGWTEGPLPPDSRLGNFSNNLCH